MKIITLIPLLLCFAIPAFSESTNPQLLDGSMPAYTETARTEGVEGIVIVEALIDEQGRVFAADVIQSVTPELDALTLAAVKTWKFAPATENGKAIMKVVRIPVNFNLIDPMDETVLKAQDAAIAVR